MKTKIDTELMIRLVNERFKNISKLLIEWKRKYKKQPDRATMNRWINQKNNPSSNHYCQLCGLLDIDPFVLLRFDELTINSYYQLRNFVINRQWIEIKTLKFIENFVGNAHVNWPPNGFLNNYYNREWETIDFKHDESLNKNFYQEIELTSLLNKKQDIPVVYHFAFLNQQPFVYWNHYGFIVRYKNQHRLFHINGNHQLFERKGDKNKVRVETWFGQYGADFRVASIHPFKLDLVASSPISVQKLRFWA